MSGVWSDARPPVRHRRIRGGEVAAPDPGAWRRQRAAATPVAPSVAAPRWLDVDGMFALAFFLSLLFIAQITTLGAAMVAGLAPLYVFVRRKGLGRILLRRGFLLLVPAVALLSVVWSEAPADSLRYAAELAITVIVGLLLSSAASQESVIRGLTLAFLIYVIVARIGGGTVGIGVGAGGEAFSGLTSSKNLLADIASSGIIVSLAAVMLALRSRAWIWLGIGGVAVGLDLFTVISARSAGALLGLGMGLGAMLAITPLIYAGKVFRGWVTCAVALCLIAGGLFYRSLSAALIELGASLFDKDPTLTGRTYLWYRAADLIREKPMLGRGYYAFWRQGNPDAEGLWQYFGIDSRSGFTFHNTLVDILVTLGWSGAVVIIAVVLIGMIALVRRFVARPSLALVFWISLWLYQLARTPIETIGIAPFYFSSVLAFAALGAGLRSKRPWPADRPRSFAQPSVLRLRALTADGASADLARLRYIDAGGAQHPTAGPPRHIR